MIPKVYSQNGTKLEVVNFEFSHDRKIDRYLNCQAIEDKSNIHEVK